VRSRGKAAGLAAVGLAVLQEVNPRFEFTDPPFPRSLPITLAFAASTSRLQRRRHRRAPGRC
jgi:hypothetical protein